MQKRTEFLALVILMVGLILLGRLKLAYTSLLDPETFNTVRQFAMEREIEAIDKELTTEVVQPSGTAAVQEFDFHEAVEKNAEESNSAPPQKGSSPESPFEFSAEEPE